jgi:hypothetical protein
MLKRPKHLTTEVVAPKEEKEEEEIITSIILNQVPTTLATTDQYADLKYTHSLLQYAAHYILWKGLGLSHLLSVCSPLHTSAVTCIHKQLFFCQLHAIYN